MINRFTLILIFLTCCLLTAIPSAFAQQPSNVVDCSFWEAFQHNKRVQKDLLGKHDRRPQVVTVTPDALKDCIATTDTSLFIVDNEFKDSESFRLYVDLSYQKNEDLYIANVHPVVAVVVWTYRFRKKGKRFILVSHAHVPK